MCSNGQLAKFNFCDTQKIFIKFCLANTNKRYNFMLEIKKKKFLYAIRRYLAYKIMFSMPFVESYIVSLLKIMF
jgi:hypothetical protein